MIAPSDFPPGTTFANDKARIPDGLWALRINDAHGKPVYRSVISIVSGRMTPEMPFVRDRDGVLLSDGTRLAKQSSMEWKRVTRLT